MGFNDAITTASVAAKDAESRQEAETAVLVAAIEAVYYAKDGMIAANVVAEAAEETWISASKALTALERLFNVDPGLAGRKG